ncbi:hypothetical protein EGH21_23975 [Halomicroarcula sp. F13]|uniref:Uncharacterized protein n=1 Tax=Haloarcula rubra TaxID=2487747 RepID=A0AAW4Q021_9EURY|nr:hypothetical protein [Halomicroarcula rubra]MBX0326070.1 hypothetical protein [Halomicroarcula rubra]
MTTQPTADQTDSLVDDHDAEHLDIDIDLDTPTTEDIRTLLDQYISDDVDPLLETLLDTLLDLTDHLQSKLEDLETHIERTHDVATTASAKTEQQASHLEDLEADQTKTHDIATTAVAKAQQLEADDDHDSLPAGVEPSSSPLDFFANCRDAAIKNAFVAEANRQNTYRAIRVAKRWPEFATTRHDGSSVFLTRDDLTTALTAELGHKPHRQTVHRVWETLLDLGGDDVTESTRQVGRQQTPTEILELDIDTAEGLLDQRYVGLDLLDGTALKATTGGVTPVVTGGEA